MVLHSNLYWSILKSGVVLGKKKSTKKVVNIPWFFWVQKMRLLKSIELFHFAVAGQKNYSCTQSRL